MKNILIFGTGRSGTSMLTGLFSKGDFQIGQDLYPPSETNPKGFFESPIINLLNEQILKLNLKSGILHPFRDKYNKKLQKGQFWFANFSSKKQFKSNISINQQIESLTKSLFCYKDPRFCYTYPVWRPYAGDHVCLIIFRHPSKTIESMIKEIDKQEYLKNYSYNVQTLNEVWVNQYKNVLKNRDSNFLFVHYDQLFEKSKLKEIAKFTGFNKFANFPDRAFDRSRGEAIPVSSSSEIIYQELCGLANFSY